MVVVGLAGEDVPLLFVALFGVGASAMMAIPTIQVLLTRFAPRAPTLLGRLNPSALNLANALGAIRGAIVLTAGFGVLGTSWAGLVLVIAGLLSSPRQSTRPKRAGLLVVIVLYLLLAAGGVIGTWYFNLASFAAEEDYLGAWFASAASSSAAVDC